MYRRIVVVAGSWRVRRVVVKRRAKAAEGREFEEIKLPQLWRNAADLGDSRHPTEPCLFRAGANGFKSL